MKRVAPLPAPATAEDLTSRERDILQHIAGGYTNKEIAIDLYLSVRTVESHRLTLMRKTRTGARRELVAMCLALGLEPVIYQGGTSKGVDVGSCKG